MIDILKGTPTHQLIEGIQGAEYLVNFLSVTASKHYLAIPLVSQMPKLINASAANLDLRTGKSREQSLSVHHTGGLVRLPPAI